MINLSTFKSKFFINFFIFFFQVYKMSENSSVKLYKDNKERLQKKLVEDIKVFLKKKKKKSENIFWNLQKYLSRWKTKAG